MCFARIAGALLAVAALPAIAQNDLAVTNILAPQSGCALTATENVSMRVFNYGSTLPAGTSFNAVYTINAGASVVELITLASPMTSNSALTYTFTTQANLSTPGSYTFDARVALAGDISLANDTFDGFVVTNSAPSVGGSVSGTSGPTLSGSLSLSGHTGSVIEWQQSDDGGLRWRRLSNTTTTQDFDLLREHTQFRALVSNVPCAPALSSPQLVLSSDPIFYSGFEP
jgi:hypothetical protein